MKKPLASALAAFIFATIFLASCSQFGNLDVQKRHYNKGFYVHRSEKPTTVAAEEKNVTIASFDAPAQQSQEPVAAKQAPVEQAQAPAAVQQQPTVTTNKAVRAIAKTKVADRPATISPVKADAPAVVSQAKKAPAQSSGKPDKALLIILAILIPWLAVGLATDWDVKQLIINLLLCLTCIGGIIHALVVVNRNA